MKKFDIDKFVKFFRIGTYLTDKVADDVRILLSFMNEDTTIVSVMEAAYMFATVQHETGRKFAPIEEWGKGKGKAYGHTADNGKIFYGRGYVQLTWDTNYKRVGKLIGVDLYNTPELALHYDIAYKIMSEGMRHGWFTGVNFGKYTKNGILNYRSARKIINGLDCADMIAKYAQNAQTIFEECYVG